MKTASGILLLLLISFVSLAQETITLTLDDCINLTLENNAKLQLQELQLDKQKNDLAYKRRFFIPDIAAQVNYFQYLDNFPLYVFPDNENSTLSGRVQLGAPQNFYSGLTLNQTLFDTRLLNGKSLRGDSEELFSMQSERSETEAIYEVSKAFYQSGIVLQGQDLLRFNQQRLDTLYTITRVAVENGFTQSSSLEEIELRIEELELKQKELEYGLIQSNNYLKMLCGIEPSQRINLQFDDIEYELEQTESVDSIQSLEYQILDKQRVLNENSILHQASGTYPTLDLFMAFQWLQQEGYGDLFTNQAEWFNQHVIGVKLNVPIVSSEDRKSKIQEVKIQNQIIAKQQELIQKSDRIKREKAIQDLQLARESLELSVKRVNYYQKRLQQETVRYENQAITIRDLLDTESSLQEENMSLQQKKLKYFISILEVYKTFGKLKSLNQSP